MTFQDSIIDKYTHGACHLLARALLEMRPDFKGSILHESQTNSHAFVIMPNGKALDINGIQTMNEIQRKWGATGRLVVYSSYKDFRRGVPELGDRGWGTPSEWDLTRSRIRKTGKKLLASIEEN